MKKKKKSFMSSYWGSDKTKKEYDKEKAAEERKERLEMIRAKYRKRKEKEKSVIDETEAKRDDDSIEEISKKLGYDIFEDNSTADRESGVGKRALTKEEIEKKRKKALENKEKLSSKELLKQKINDLENQISNTKYNKKTQHAIGLMKAQLANFKLKLSGGGGGKGKVDDGYAVKKSGDATVVLLGFPSTGKSTLLNKLTNANSRIGGYAFTTLTVIPGVLNHKQAKIQILDVPGIVEGAARGTGRGKEVLQVIRTADLIIILVDAFKPLQKRLLEKEVYETNIRLNKKNPDVRITKTAKDGVRVGRTVETPELDDDTIKGILNQFRIINANVLIRDTINADQLIDVVEGNKVYIPSLTVVNKIDLLNPEQIKKLNDYLKPDLCISADKGEGINKLKELIFKKLNFIRLYLKEVDKKPDLDEPLIMKRGDTLRILCLKLHKDFAEKFKFARVWGKSVRFDGQKILKLEHKLEDKDIIELHMT